MKNSGVCPKCQSTDILLIPGSAGAYGTGNNIKAGFTIFSSVPVARYLCSRCGFSEEWIVSQDDIEKLRKKYGSR